MLAYAVHFKDNLRFSIAEITNYDTWQISALREQAFGGGDEAIHTGDERHLSNEVVMDLDVLFACHCFVFSLRRGGKCH